MENQMTNSLPATHTDKSKSLTPEQNEHLKKLATAIRRIDSGMNKPVFSIGKILVTVKNQLDHGQFSKWLAVEVGYTQRTAQNYMNAFRQLGDKSETVSCLPVKTVYDLTALPKDQCDEIVKLITDLANPPIAEIKKRIAIQRAANRPDPQQVYAEKKKAAKEKARAKKLAKATPAAQEAARKREARAAKKGAAAILAFEQRRQTVVDQSARWMNKLDSAMLHEIYEAVSNIGQQQVMEAIKVAIDALLTTSVNAETSLHQPSYEIAIDASEGAATHETDLMAA
jgi:hypothetical protein